MRRVIIGTAGFAAYCFVFFVSILGGIVGYGYGSWFALVTTNHDTGRVIGTSVGVAVGFLLASVAAATLFLLIEIATNTRRTARMLDAYEPGELPIEQF